MLDTVKEIDEKLKDNFDFKKREIDLQNGKATVFYMATLSDANYISMYIIKPLTERRGDITDFQSVGDTLQTGPVGELKSTEDAISRILFGDTVIALPFVGKLLFCETRKINSRSIGKTEFDVSLKGSKESFNELIFDNIGLIRKRIISESLKVLPFKLGRKSNTTAALVYLDKIAPPELIKHIKEKLEGLDTDYVLSINNISEALKTDKSSFDTSGYSEKPDTLVSRLYEGRVAVIVEGSPFVLTVPSFFIENFQSSDDYYSNRFQTGLVRFIRLSALMVSLTLPALYIVLTTINYSLLPTTFMFKLAVSRAGVPFPTVVEMVLMQFFFELAKEAGKRLPQQIGQSLSVVAGLILGESAVGMGLASQATVVVVGVYAICSFINPGLMGTALIWSFVITGLSVIFGLHGFYITFILFIAQVSSLRTCGYPYMFPLGTVKKFTSPGGDLLLRGPLNRISSGILTPMNERKNKNSNGRIQKNRSKSRKNTDSEAFASHQMKE